MVMTFINVQNEETAWKDAAKKISDIYGENVTGDIVERAKLKIGRHLAIEMRYSNINFKVR